VLTLEKKGFLGSSIVLFRSRKEAVFAITWPLSLATIIAGKGFPPITESFLSIIAVTLLTVSVYVYNDIIDRDMDAFSKQEKKKLRPIANGTISITNATRFVFITGLTGLGLCLMINPLVFAIGFVYFLLFFLYSYPSVRFKKMYLIKNLVTSLLLPIGFLMGGASIEKTISMRIGFLSIAYYVLTFFVVPAIADMLDYEEDLAFNVKTIGNSLSWKQNLVLYNIGILVFISSSVIGYLFFDFSGFVPILTSIIGISMMVYSYFLRAEDGLTASYKLRPITYTLILVNPLLLALGTIF
jgi:4-hydroxybenzoate polyprenyltransferase